MFTYDPELNWEFTAEKLGVQVELAKVGGGTVGREYVGWWQWRVTDGDMVESGMFESRVPYSHDYAALFVAAFYGERDED